MNDPLDGARLLAKQLGFSRCYFVTENQRFMQSFTKSERELFSVNEHAVAFTSPVLDLQFKQGSLRYEHDGRGPCIAFVKNPFLMSDEKRLGITIHELAHYVANYNHPARDEPNEKKALELFSQIGFHDDAHRVEWFRSCIHLYHRATKCLGYEIPLKDVISSVPEYYGYSRDAVWFLLTEAQEREGDSIETILQTVVDNSPSHQESKKAPTQQAASNAPQPQASAGITVWNQGSDEPPMHFNSIEDYLSHNRQKMADKRHARLKAKREKANAGANART